MTLDISGTDSLSFTEPVTSVTLGNSTLLVVMNRSANSGGTNNWAVAGNTSGGSGRFGLGFGTADKARAFFGGSVSPSVMTITTSDGWVCFAVTKTVGTTTPRFHKYVYSTGVATHEDGTAATASPAVLGSAATLVLGRLTPSTAPTCPGSYAAAAIFDRVLSDSEFESAAQSLAAMKALGPNWGLWTLDSDLTSGTEFFVGSTYASGSATSMGENAPFGYGDPVLVMDDVGGAVPAGSGTATLTADGVLTSTGSGAVIPPTPTPSLPGGTGWTLLSVSPANVATEIKFTNTGQFTHDQSRPVRRAITGFTLLPSEAAKVDLARDSVHAYLRVDDQTYPMGIFYFTESSRAKDAIKDDDGNPADLIHVSLSDQFIKLQRSDEIPRFALSGADPSQEMIRYLSETGIPHSITGAASPISEDVVWQPFTVYEQIVSQLAELAGHRRPWADNYGIIRSVASRVVDSEVIPIEDLEPIDGTIVITDNYLSAPNRVVVYDDQGPYPIVGVWDAPSTAPNSAATRGWVQTAGVQAQGLSGTVHAQQMAQTIGEQMAARRLAGDIIPTNRLDGPVVLSYDGALWLVNGWSVSTAVGSTMSFDASELVLPPNQGTLRA